MKTNRLKGLRPSIIIASMLWVIVGGCHAGTLPPTSANGTWPESAFKIPSNDKWTFKSHPITFPAPIATGSATPAPSASDAPQAYTNASQATAPF